MPSLSSHAEIPPLPCSFLLHPAPKYYILKNQEGIDEKVKDNNIIDNNINNNYLKKRCQKCNRELEKDFEYCPYCGEKIK